MHKLELSLKYSKINQKHCFIIGPSVSFEQLRTSVFDVVGSDPVEANSGTASGTSSVNKIISGMI